MPILSSDLEMYKSNNTDSTGGTISATPITDSVVNNLFDDVSSAEAAAGSTEYRKIFFKNKHASLTLLNTVFWRSQDTDSSDDEIFLGLGTANDDDGSSILSSFTGAARVALISDGIDVRNVTIVGLVSGVRTVEVVALNSTSEVLSTNTFDAGGVYLIYPASADASRIITIKQGSGGATKGTIVQNRLSCICYFNVSSKPTGLLLGSIANGASQGLWLKRVVSSSAGARTNNTGIIKVEGDTT